MAEERDLVTYCGLYCGDCSSHQGKIADLARDLRKELRQAKFDKHAEILSTVSFFEVFQNYRQCYEVLGALVKMRCKNACRGGGGPPFCKMRKCCQKKVIEGCWQCGEFETCQKLDFLKPFHGDAHLRNLRKIKKQGTNEFINGKRYW
ncbi:DUF3795 domain-containing protein [Chloroflexota bacterium]